MSGSASRPRPETISIDELASIPSPPGFVIARPAIREAVSRCDGNGIASEAVCAALLAEILPRLIHAHGPHGVADMLERLGTELRKLPAMKQYREMLSK